MTENGEKQNKKNETNQKHKKKPNIKIQNLGRIYVYVCVYLYLEIM